MTLSLLDIAFLVTLLILAFIPKKRWGWVLFVAVLAGNFAIRFYYINNSHILKRELQQTKEMAKPPVLSLSAIQVDAKAKNPTVLLQFSPSKNQPLASLSFVITIIDPGSAKILNVGRRSRTIADSKCLNPDGRSATISFTPLGSGPPILVLETSEPCKFRIEGNYITEPIELELKRQMPNKSVQMSP